MTGSFCFPLCFFVPGFSLSFELLGAFGVCLSASGTASSFGLFKTISVLSSGVSTGV